MPPIKTIPVDGEAIRALRIREGWTQQQLASRADVAQSHLSAIESGTKEPSVLAVSRIARALSVPTRLICPAWPGDGQ